MREEVESPRLYSEEQREASARQPARDGEVGGEAAQRHDRNNREQLREALRIRLSILSDNVHGFVSAADIDRRDRYTSMQNFSTTCRTSRHCCRWRWRSTWTSRSRSSPTSCARSTPGSRASAASSSSARSTASWRRCRRSCEAKTRCPPTTAALATARG